MKKTILVAAISASMVVPLASAFEQGTVEVNGKTISYYINENGDVIYGKPAESVIEKNVGELIDEAMDSPELEVTMEDVCATAAQDYEERKDLASKVFDQVCNFSLSTEEKYAFASGFSLEVYKAVGETRSMQMLGTLNLHGHQQTLDHVSKPKEYKEINRVVGYTLGGEKLHSDWSATINYDETVSGEIAVNLNHTNVRAIDPKTLTYTDRLYTVNPQKASELSLVKLAVNEIEPIYTASGDQYFVKLIK